MVRSSADNHLSKTPDSPHSEVTGSGSSAIKLTVRRENLAASSKVIDIGKKVAFNLPELGPWCTQRRRLSLASYLKKPDWWTNKFWALVYPLNTAVWYILEQHNCTCTMSPTYSHQVLGYSRLLKCLGWGHSWHKNVTGNIKLSHHSRFKNCEKVHFFIRGGLFPREISFYVETLVKYIYLRPKMF